MKKNILVISAVGLLAVIIVALALYNNLGKDIKPDNLSAVETEASSRTDDSTVDESSDTDSTTEQTSETTELSAPDFTVQDINGDTVSLSDYKGTPVVLNFWASWCGPCKGEMPDFQKAFQTYGDKIQFMMVNMTDGGQETVDTASAFISKSDFTFPVFFDTDGSGATAYEVYSIPTTFFIDENGNVSAYSSGMIDENTLEKGIGMITEQ